MRIIRASTVLLTLALCVCLPAGASLAAKSDAKAAKAAAPRAAKPGGPPAATTPPPGPAPSDKGFALKDTPGEYLDIYLDGRAVARYMYASDASTPEKANATYKPYLHVFDAEGKAPITKGPGGRYTHHRGIFIGWQRIGFGGKTYNLWEMGGGNRQVHQKFLAQAAGPDEAAFTSLVAWNLADGKTIIEEERTCTFRRRPAPTLALIDFTSKVKAVAGDLVLDGNAEHAGVHYRPADNVDKAAVKYCLPKEGVDEHLERDADWNKPSYIMNGNTVPVTKIAAADLPWAAESYALAGKVYNVEEMNHPDNPKGTLWSAYRDYGRLGAFPKKELANGATLALRYRFWVTAGEPPTRADFQKQWEAYAKAPESGAAK